MNLLKCDKEVARSCPHKKACYGSEEHINDAIYAEGSDCDKYNRGLRHPAAETAGVEPVRHGQWERCFEDWRQQIEGDKCTACGFEYYGTGISRFHYCPNCGAKIQGGENGG